MEPIRRAGLRSVIEEMSSVILLESDLDGLLAAESLDLILMSLMLPKEMARVVERIRTVRPAMRIVIMGPEGERSSILSAFVAGARGFVHDAASPEEVKQTIEIVASGSIWAPRDILTALVDRLLMGDAKPSFADRPQFTKREVEVLQLLLSARYNREIAKALGIEVRTVKSYVGRLMRKVGVGNRIALSMQAATYFPDVGSRKV